MLFQNLHAIPGLRDDENISFDDQFLQELLNSKPLNRLKNIGFLGAIDYSQVSHRHNRYVHSVGVSKLAEQYSAARDINEHDSRILIAAGLLHDVGHGPLSHTLESIFDQEFGVNHHSMTQRGGPAF